MTTIAWCTSFSALTLRLDALALTATALSVMVLFPEDTVGRISLNILVLAFVNSRLSLEAGSALVAFLVAASCFCARLLQAGAFAGTDLTADCLLLRSFATLDRLTSNNAIFVVLLLLSAGLSLASNYFPTILCFSNLGDATV